MWAPTFFLFYCSFRSQTFRKFGLWLVIFSGTRRTNRKITYRNKIAEMKNNSCSLSNLTKNVFVLYFSTKKRTEKNKKKNNLLWMVIFLEIIKNSVFPFVFWSPPWFITFNLFSLIPRMQQTFWYRFYFYIEIKSISDYGVNTNLKTSEH